MDDNIQLERKRSNAQKKLSKEGKLTHQLKLAIERTETLEELKELLAPLQTKRRTLAAQARENGLEPIADALWLNSVSEVKSFSH